MKRPKVADRAAERQARREKARSATASGLAASAVVLAGIRGGMLYDRFPSSIGASWFDLVAVPVATALLGLALVVWVIADRRRGGCADPWVCAATILGSATLGWTALCLKHTPVVRAGLSIVSILALGLGVAILTGAVCRSRRRAGVVAAAVALTATALAVTGVQEYLIQWRSGDAAWRIFAGFAVPNFLAGLFVITIPLTVALFLRSRERTAAWATGAGLALQFPALLLTQSRLGVLALAVGALTFGIGALILRSSSKRASASGGTQAVRIIGMATLALVVGLAAARPVIGRLRASKDQSYSARFRVMTWSGVGSMVRAMPVMGAGPGAFDVRYPRYARVGYTQHAHNSYLQQAAETGLPGALLLIATLGSVVVVGFRGLRSVPRADGADHDGIVLAGLLAGLVGALTHNVFDSDLYVPAIAVTMGAICGLIVSYARPASSGAPHAARSAPSFLWRTPAGLLGIALLAAGGLMTPARLWVAEASAAMSAGDVYGALDAYRHAAKLDPFDPEHHLAMAYVLKGMDERDAALSELTRATQVANIGKTWYRLGRHLLEEGDAAGAVRALERARRLDPLHLRGGLALAQAYSAAGRPGDAHRVYVEMTQLHGSPVGQIRAVPEVVDWEYGMAYAELAEDAMEGGRTEEASDLLRRAEAVLGELWRTRHEPMVALRVSHDAMQEAQARYEWVLEQRVRLADKSGSRSDARAAADALAAFRAEREKEAEGAATP